MTALPIWRNEQIARLATEVMGWTWDDIEGAWRTPEGCFEIAGWDPLTEMTDAWTIVMKMVSRMGYAYYPADPWANFDWRGPMFKPENRYLTNEGYPLGTTCWYVTVECRGLREWFCASTPELAICQAALWVMDEIAEGMKKAEAKPGA